MAGFSDLDRQQLIVPWPLFAGGLTNVDGTPGSNVYLIAAPFNGVITALELRVGGGTASSQLIMEILRGGAVGVGSAIATSATVAVTSGGAVGVQSDLDVKVMRGETLYLIARGSDADGDDFTDVSLIAWANPMQA